MGYPRGAVAVLHPDDTVWCPPGEQHWYGAGPEHVTTHPVLREGEAVDWAEPVTDAEYGRAASEI